MCVDAVGPISVGVDDQLRSERGTKKNVIVYGSMEVAKNSLGSCEV